MQTVTNNRYSTSSEPLHNAQSEAPRYLLLDDLSPRLNISAQSRTNPLTTRGAEPGGTSTSHSLTNQSEATGIDCLKYFHPVMATATGALRGPALPALFSFMAGAVAKTPYRDSVYGFATVALFSLAVSLYNDRSEAARRLCGSLASFGMGIWFNYCTYGEGDCTVYANPNTGGSSPTPP